MDGTLAVDEPDHVIIDCADCRHFRATASRAPKACRWRWRCGLRRSTCRATSPAGDSPTSTPWPAPSKEMSYFGRLHRLPRRNWPVALRLKARGQRLSRRGRNDPWGDDVWAHWSLLRPGGADAIDARWRQTPPDHQRVRLAGSPGGSNASGASSGGHRLPSLAAGVLHCCRSSSCWKISVSRWRRGLQDLITCQGRPAEAHPSSRQLRLHRCRTRCT